MGAHEPLELLQLPCLADHEVLRDRLGVHDLDGQLIAQRARPAGSASEPGAEITRLAGRDGSGSRAVALQAEGRQAVGECGDRRRGVVVRLPRGVQPDLEDAVGGIDREGDEPEAGVVRDDGDTPARGGESLRDLGVGALQQLAVAQSGAIHGGVEDDPWTEVRRHHDQRPLEELGQADPVAIGPGVVVADLGGQGEDRELS